MSLKTLLGAGRSFLGMNGEKSPYKISTEKLVPKFGETPPLPTCELKQAELAALAKGTPPHTHSITPTPEKATVAAAPEVVGQKKRNVFGWPWFKLVNPFSGKAKAAKRLVQAELLLGKVEPLRNDLSDSDLMVVTKPKDEIAKKRLWLAQSLLEHNRKDAFRGEETSREMEPFLQEQSSSRKIPQGFERNNHS